jgi:ribonuclease HII
MLAVLQRPVAYTPRSDAGLAGFERVLHRAGLGPVAGIDEAGRGACAGPLVVAAAILRPSRPVPGLADSKALTAQARDKAYDQIVKSALDWSVVIIPPGDIDRLGLHVCNVSGMRRALAALTSRPGYVLTDGFPVRGLAVPALAMWKGDQVAACVAAASIIAKVTRDRIMSGLHDDFPTYGFARHKGYSTPSHMKALAQHGPCAEHRRSFVNVAGAAAAAARSADPGRPDPEDPAAGPGGRADQPAGPEGLEYLADGPAGAAGGAPGPAGPGDAPEDRHNGPIVDVIGEHAWPAASLASGAPHGAGSA